MILFCSSILLVVDLPSFNHKKTGKLRDAVAFPFQFFFF